MIRNDATQAQIDAADPGCSTWLSANAGSGKTSVLTNRVARLLIDGVPPQRILCLTYTKAAASEMQNRLFRRLGEWVMQDDVALARDLDELGLTPEQNTLVQREAARTLFARAIETPGGLKIQTIHSFCASLLRRFPLEAGVSPVFRDIDARSDRALRRSVLDQMAEDGTGGPLRDLVLAIGDGELDGLVDDIVAHRTSFSSAPDPEVLRQTMGLPDVDTANRLLEMAATARDAELLGRILPHLRTGSTNDQKAADALSAVMEIPRGPDWLPHLEQVFLYKTSKKDPFGPKLDRFPTQSTRDALGEDREELASFMCRVAEARPIRLAEESLKKTLLVANFAVEFLRTYEAEKLSRGLLDFDDQILRARKLLSDRDVAQWVLFRLDGGIDHVLVDEAQDTSPAQWDVIRLLTQEFTTGESARGDLHRTIFVVGDQKQSIYSFQGADPAGFDRMRTHFREAHDDVGAPFQNRELLHSFRSSGAVLDLVDRIFASDAGRGLGTSARHIAFHQKLPGRVDLWPVVEQEDKREETQWYEPVDQPAGNDARLVLANRVADGIRDILRSGAQITVGKRKDEARPVEPRDILVLVQRRSEFFREIIKACKDRGLAIAGSDRLKVGGVLAVRDILAALAFADLPEDSLSLACALKSPIFGWSESELYDLAQGRSQTFLWAELRDRRDEWLGAVEVLDDIRRQADFLRPFELIERLLTRHGARARLVARLGPEADDGIDALLSQALAYEAVETPSLSGFLTWFDSESEDIKRQFDTSRNEIRVMTVHGAKGLEAPVVILPDCAKPRARRGPLLVELDGDAVALRAPMDASPPVLADAQRLQSTRAAEERNRLLYVATTRAESWLIVAAAGDVGSGEDSWYSLISEAVADGGSVPIDTPTGPGARHQTGTWPDDALGEHDANTPEGAPKVPPLVLPAVAAGQDAPVPLSPSDMGGEKYLEGESGGRPSEDALLHGTRVHRLLEVLSDAPRDTWKAVAEAVLRETGSGLSDTPGQEAFEEAARVIDAPQCSMVFAPDTLAEVPIAATVDAASGTRIFGVIDRLVVSTEQVTAIDFKTNAVLPETPEDVPEGLLRQMGAYDAALRLIYPDVPVRTAILWTRSAQLMQLPHELVMPAFERGVLLDAPAVRS